MCYYTVTMDHANRGEHTRAIMIVDAKDKQEAEAQFLVAFGPEYYKSVNVCEGIHIEKDFDKLLTEHVKKYILKVKTKAEDAPPLLSYQNMIHLKF